MYEIPLTQELFLVFRSYHSIKHPRQSGLGPVSSVYDVIQSQRHSIWCWKFPWLRQQELPRTCGAFKHNVRITIRSKRTCVIMEQRPPCIGDTMEVAVWSVAVKMSRGFIFTRTHCDDGVGDEEVATRPLGRPQTRGCPCRRPYPKV